MVFIPNLLTAAFLIGVCTAIQVDPKTKGKLTVEEVEDVDLFENEDAPFQVSINSEEATKLLNDILSESAESSRSGDLNNEDEKNSLNGISRKRLLNILGESPTFDSKIPANREFVRINSTAVKNITSGDDKVSNSSLRGYNENGLECIQKVVLVEETIYDRSLKCHHTLKKKCHTTYITDYTSSPEKKCDTQFNKNCRISFKPVPHTETFKKCHTPHIQKCGEEVVGPEVCKTEYEDHCETTYKEYTVHEEVPKCEEKEETRCKLVPVDLLNLPDTHDLDSSKYAQKEICEKWPVKKCEIKSEEVTKTHPQTQCEKVPRKVCSHSNCITVPGRKICNQETRTVIQNLPEEKCDLEPQKNCRTESTLLPKLVPKKNCIKVPKEVCVGVKSNPKVVKKPIVKNWCYNPREYYN